MGISKIGYSGMNPVPSSVNFGQNASTQSIQQLYGQAQPISLVPGQVSLIPQGQWVVTSGLYSQVQYLDSGMQAWRNLRPDRGPSIVSSDGTNYRVANLSGCPVGAVVTNAGTNASNAAGFYPAVTTAGIAPTTGYSVVASAGGSTWNMWVGGAIATNPTITTAGTLYTAAPLLVVLPPSNQGGTPF